MKEIAAALLAQLGDFPGKNVEFPMVHGTWRVDRRAVLKFGERVVIFLAVGSDGVRLGVGALREKYLPEGFSGEHEALPGGGCLLTGVCERKNAAALRRYCPKCAPSAPEKTDELVQVSDFSGADGDFLLFCGDAADLCNLRDRLSFAAFADGMTKKYALGGVAESAATAARLLDCGATCLDFAVQNAATAALPAEYQGKKFVLTPEHVVTIGDAAFPAELLREAEKIARLAAAHHAVWRLRFAGRLSVAEHLVIARELYKKSALPQSLICAASENERKEHAAIAACYGKYDLKTVSE